MFRNKPFAVEPKKLMTTDPVYEKIRNSAGFGIWVPYKEYLKTAWWKFKREQKIRSVDGRCERCLKKNRLQVHHLHYRSLWGEKNYDLEVLCAGCHILEHSDLIENRLMMKRKEETNAI